MKVDKSLIHTFNKHNVLSAVREAGQIFRAEIARQTGLSIPTVMKITDELLARGIVREIGKGESSGGKPPQLLAFTPDRHYIVGVDIGTTNILCILMDMSAHIVASRSVPTRVDDAPEAVMERIAHTIAAVVDGAGAERDRILGIGIGMPGVLEPQTGRVLFSPDFHWEQVHLLPKLKASFPYPMIIRNVTHAMAMGERWFGQGRGDFDSFVCVNLGHGIGSALFLEGKLLSGGSGSSGELGHVTMDRNGPKCVCGNAGCLEALASGNAIAKHAAAEIAAGHDTILRQELERKGALEAKDVFVAAGRQDALSIRIVQEAAEYIGLALASVINLVDPELIVLEGGLSRAGEPFIADIRTHAQRYQMKYTGRNTRIVVSGLGEQAAAIGAASFIVQRLFEAGGDPSTLE